MAKKRIFDLPETKGQFQIKGIVSGVEKQNFYTEGKTRNNKPKRQVRFGLQYEKENAPIYVKLTGYEQDKVYFYKRPEDKKSKGITKAIDWSDRFNFDQEGFTPIGIKIGVKKIEDKDNQGQFINDKKTLTDFDACKEIAQYLKDDKSVFAKGNLNCFSFEDDKGSKKTSISLEPNQISLCKDIDFDDENFKQQNFFRQVIIFQGIHPEKDDKGKPTSRFVVDLNIVTYSSVENTSMIIENKKLARIFKEKLKPYTSIQVSGEIKKVLETSIVNDAANNDNDTWGEEDAMEKVNNPTRREFVITGAKPSTIDTEVYAENNMQKAIEAIKEANKAKKDFGESSNNQTDDDWGNIGTDDDDCWD